MWLGIDHGNIHMVGTTARSAVSVCDAFSGGCHECHGFFSPNKGRNSSLIWGHSPGSSSVSGLDLGETGAVSRVNWEKLVGLARDSLNTLIASGGQDGPGGKMDLDFICRPAGEYWTGTR